MQQYLNIKDTQSVESIELPNLKELRTGKSEIPRVEKVTPIKGFGEN